ncbi:hypothetical protein [Pseudoalteromonas galatheae]|uniref:hypothetical protein n=1 Tax=Pseudoalteromonas galatheae TaxID=579562 RepID=UPI0030D158D7
MVALSRFIPKVLESVSNQPPFMVERSLIATLRDFAKQSLCWEETLTLQFNQGKEAALELPEHTLLNRIIHAFDEDLPLVQNRDYHVNIHSERLMWLNSTPPRQIIVSVSLIPDTSATEVPDFFFDRYHEAIAAGAALRSQGANGIPQYQQYELKTVYNDAVKEAKDIALNGHARVVPQFKHRFI